MSQFQIRRLAILVMLGCTFVLPCVVQADKDKKGPAGPAVLWREPTDIESRNLLLGAGGEKMKPDLSTVTFIEKEGGGYSTKYRVRDAAGNEWIAKVGKEAQSETAANRLLWGVGYESEIVYLVPSLTIQGKGTFENVRLEARPERVHRGKEWKWADNPFKGKREFQGLKVMMVFINNWDIKDANNVILKTTNETTGEPESHYIISDLGGSLGKTGGIFSRSRNKPTDFVKADFIESVKNNVINFNYGGKNKALFDDITVEDGAWIGGLLSRLTDEQIKDAFRAANYSPEEVENLCKAVRDRIEALNSLSNTATN